MYLRFLWQTSKSQSGSLLKTSAAVDSKMWIVGKIQKERHPHSYMTSLVWWASEGLSIPDSGVMISCTTSLDTSASVSGGANYVERLCNEPEYRAQLEAEIKVRWRKYNKRRWKQREFGDSYKLRGSNKELARRLGRPTEYDRLAVLATSVFHLSHWRCDVTVSNYLLAY